MSFFKKLKNKLFKSSSKIDEGLDAIVSDGGVAEDLVEDTAAQEVAEAEARAAQEAEAARVAEEEAERAAAAAAEEARHAEEARLAEEQQRLEAEAQAAAAREEARLAQEAEEAARIAALEKQAAEARAQEAEAARLEEIERQAAEERAKAQAAEAERIAAREAEKAARLKREADAAAAKAEEDARRLAEEQSEAARVAAAKAEQDRLAAEKAEADRIAAEDDDGPMTEADFDALADTLDAEVEAAAEAAAAPPVRDAVVAPMTTLQPSALDIAEEEDAPAEKKGIIGRFFGGQKKTVVRRVLDDDMLEQLEELLITADMGVDTALRVTANMAEGRLGKKLSVAEIKELMATEIARIMDPVARPMPLYTHKPQVVLVVGVNGSGKTTTIGKLASQFKAAGKSVVIAAGDTFRAAAVEQLQVWGDRAGVPVLTAPEGSDPASLAFDAMTQAQADGADLLMIDTAGRLQNRADLMEELSKIVRVIRKKDPDAPHNTLLVLDATTGQNALNQVKAFQDLADVSGLVMTKLDGTAKGGVLVALSDKFGLPIHAIGVGEQIDDLAPFDPEEFAKALVGLE